MQAIEKAAQVRWALSYPAAFPEVEVSGRQAIVLEATKASFNPHIVMSRSLFSLSPSLTDLCSFRAVTGL